MLLAGILFGIESWPCYPKTDILCLPKDTTVQLKATFEQFLDKTSLNTKKKSGNFQHFQPTGPKIHFCPCQTRNKSAWWNFSWLHGIFRKWPSPLFCCCSDGSVLFVLSFCVLLSSVHKLKPFMDCTYWRWGQLPEVWGATSKLTHCTVFGIAVAMTVFRMFSGFRWLSVS